MNERQRQEGARKCDALLHRSSRSARDDGCQPDHVGRDSFPQMWPRSDSTSTERCSTTSTSTLAERATFDGCHDTAASPHMTSASASAALPPEPPHPARSRTAHGLTPSASFHLLRREPNAPMRRTRALIGHPASPGISPNIVHALVTIGRGGSEHYRVKTIDQNLPAFSSHTSNLPAMPHPFTRCWESGRYQHTVNGSGEGAAAIRQRLEPPGHWLGCSASPTGQRHVAVGSADFTCLLACAPQTPGPTRFASRP